MKTTLSVIISTHNPRLDYLQIVLEALREQTLPSSQWELIIVDNKSDPPVAGRVNLAWHAHAQIVSEEKLGLTNARLCGIRHTVSDIIVLVDDDNVLAPDYLENAQRWFEESPQLGAVGGKSLPRFEAEPPMFAKEFVGLLACRDLGDEPLLSQGLRLSGSTHKAYPAFAPIGAGMVLRRNALKDWLNQNASLALPDRQGIELTSSGDNDMVLTMMEAEWEVAYVPKLMLTHLIPANRTKARYLARLNHGIQKSWVQVLAKHNACPWPSIPRWTVPLRKFKAWFAYRAWAGIIEHIRWCGACGQFEGFADSHTISTNKSRTLRQDRRV